MSSRCGAIAATGTRSSAARRSSYARPARSRSAPLPLRPGQAAFVPAAAHDTRITGSGEAYRGGVPGADASRSRAACVRSPIASRHGNRRRSGGARHRGRRGPARLGDGHRAHQPRRRGRSRGASGGADGSFDQEGVEDRGARTSRSAAWTSPRSRAPTRPGKVRALCAKAIRPDPLDPTLPAVAAVCVYPELVPVAVKARRRQRRQGRQRRGLVPGRPRAAPGAPRRDPSGGRVRRRRDRHRAQPQRVPRR